MTERLALRLAVFLPTLLAIGLYQAGMHDLPMPWQLRVVSWSLAIGSGGWLLAALLLQALLHRAPDARWRQLVAALPALVPAGFWPTLLAYLYFTEGRDGLGMFTSLSGLVVTMAAAALGVAAWAVAGAARRLPFTERTS